MEQAASYGGGGNFVPLGGHNSAPAVNSLAYDLGVLNLYSNDPPREPTYVPHEMNYESASSKSFYNPYFTYAPPQPSVPSYSPRAPSYEDYTTGLTSNALSYSDAGGYGGGFQSYRSIGLPAAGGYEQVGYNQFAYEQPGYGHQENGRSSYEGRGFEGNGYDSLGENDRLASFNLATYDDGGYAEVHGYDGGSRSGAASFGGMKATPKVEESDASGGILKHRVKMLPDMSSSTSKDVSFQIGLDGVRKVELVELYVSTHSTQSRDGRVPWMLKSKAYVFNPAHTLPTLFLIQSPQHVFSYSAFVEWVSTIPPRVPGEEEKYHWVPDEDVGKCRSCHIAFSTFNRKHHCRNCGDIYCDNCTKGRTALTAEEGAQVLRVCDRCLAEVTQRLINAKDTSKVPVLVSHEDLAKKLQEELERNAGRKELKERR